MSHPRVVRTVLMGLLMAGAVAWPDTAVAAERTERRVADDAPAAESEGSSWGPIVGGCLGVLFGGAIAVWQIRGMAKRD